jgi:hypothetical protein
LFRHKDIVVTGYQANGKQVQQSFTLDWIQDGPGGAVDFQKFNVAGFDALSHVTFTKSGTSSGFFSLDNIAVTPAQVPEPASLALLGLGLAGLFSARRKY